MSFKRALYSLFLYLIFPLVILRLFWRSRANPAYRHRIMERLGVVKRPEADKPIIWVHAVSVGETIAAKPLIERLMLQHPDHQILVTCTTPTGSEQVKSLFGDRVLHVYFPYDLPEIIARFLKRMQPRILIVVETEIWPNLYAACHKRNIPIMMVNARLSPRSTQSYQKIKGLITETLSYVNLIAVRSEGDADNFKKIGAIPEKISVAGNIKFDIEPDQAQIEKGKKRRKAWGEARPVWVAASTHKGEDELILQIHLALRERFPDLLLLLIPRHPERFDAVFELLSAETALKTVRHTQIKDYKDLPTDIILGDSMGEMQSWFACADVAFIGGSLVPTGGHNPLEAIVQNVPVVSGHYLFNFADITDQLDKTGLLFVAQTAEDVTEEVAELLMLKGDEYAKKATAIMQQHSGVTARLAQSVSNVIES